MNTYCLLHRYRSFYFISDDVRFYRPSVMKTLSSYFHLAPTVLPIYDRRLARLGVMPGLSNAGRFVIRRHRVAEIVGAARHGAHVVGSGASPSTQLLMHLIGARCGVDPNFVALVEEDARDLKVEVR